MDGMNVDVVRQLQEERDKAVAQLAALGYKLGEPIGDMVSKQKLTALFEVERDKADIWRRRCNEYGLNGLNAATQSVLDWNKAILLVKGL